MSSIRRHLSYANVVATLALVFAMGGSAIAANHYLVNSTKQINPRVLKKLRGARGAKGPAGERGAAGTKGLEGAKGDPGPRGEAGPRGETGAKGEEGASALSPASSGASESGVYGTGADGRQGEHLTLVVTFPKPLTEAIPVSHVFYLTAGASNAHCAGAGHAAPGYLCIYSSVVLGLETPGLIDPEDDSNMSTGRLGFALSWKSTPSKLAGEEEVDLGTYTVTAP